MRPCRLYAELTMLVAREYFGPAIGSSTKRTDARALIVSSTTGATRSMKSTNTPSKHLECAGRRLRRIYHTLPLRCSPSRSGPDRPRHRDYAAAKRILITRLRQLQTLGRTEHEHTVFAGVLRWRAIRSSSRKASARPVSPRFTEPKSNVMRRSSNGAGRTGSNVLGAIAPFTASSRAARGVYSSVTRVASRPLSKRERSSLRASCRCASGSRRSTWSRNQRRAFQYRTRSTPWRHPDGRLDDEAQARSSHAGAQRQQTLEGRRPDGRRLYRRRPVRPARAGRSRQDAVRRCDRDNRRWQAR